MVAGIAETVVAGIAETVVAGIAEIVVGGIRRDRGGWDHTYIVIGVS